MAEWIEESFFTWAPRDGLCVTHNGHLPLAPFPDGIPRLEEARLQPGFLLLAKLRGAGRTGQIRRMIVRGRPRSRTPWVERARAAVYWYPYLAAATIVIGLYLHVTRLFLGDDLLLERVFTTQFDMVLAVPMACAAVLGLATWRLMRFRSRRHQLLCVAALVYIAGSTPLHLATYVTQSTGYLRWFPMWFSVVLLPWYVAVTASVLRIRYRATPDH